MANASWSGSASALRTYRATVVWLAVAGLVSLIPHLSEFATLLGASGALLQIISLALFVRRAPQNRALKTRLGIITAFAIAAIVLEYRSVDNFVLGPRLNVPIAIASAVCEFVALLLIQLLWMSAAKSVDAEANARRFRVPLGLLAIAAALLVLAMWLNSPAFAYTAGGIALLSVLRQWSALTELEARLAEAPLRKSAKSRKTKA